VESIVEHHDAKGVQELTLLFVDAFNVAVKNRIWIDCYLKLRLEPVDESNFCLTRSLTETIAEGLVFGQRLATSMSGSWRYDC
jgi:hypothetical protein